MVFPLPPRNIASPTALIRSISWRRSNQTKKPSWPSQNRKHAKLKIQPPAKWNFAYMIHTDTYRVL
uniref:Uncharacterized protein n=1 Tax=Arundo donax TaxID=35708 RepID=A0A0A9DQX9_ARUDO